MEMGWDRQIGALILPVGTVAASWDHKDRMIWAPRGPHKKVPLMFRGALWLPLIMFPVDGLGDVLRFRHQDDRYIDQALMAKVYNMSWNDYISTPNSIPHTILLWSDPLFIN